MQGSNLQPVRRAASCGKPLKLTCATDQANTQPIMPKKLSLALAILLLAFSSISQAQTLKTLVHQPPNGALLSFLLTDGSVMCQGNGSSDWWKLTPDINGS
jgi:hypothetical protein